MLAVGTYLDSAGQFDVSTAVALRAVRRKNGSRDPRRLCGAPGLYRVGGQQLSKGSVTTGVDLSSGHWAVTWYQVLSACMLTHPPGKALTGPGLGVPHSCELEHALALNLASCRSREERWVIHKLICQPAASLSQVSVH